MKLLRRLIAVLIVAVYVGATVIQAAVMTPAPAMSSGMAMQEGSGDPMPCHHGKGMVPGCVADLGCVFLVSLPVAPDLTLVARVAWSSITYGGITQELRGLSIKPALGPPISHA